MSELRFSKLLSPVTPTPSPAVTQEFTIGWSL